MGKIYTDKCHRIHSWFQSISNVHKTCKDVRFIFRGDSDPMLQWNGMLFDHYAVMETLDEWYEEDKATVDELKDVSFDDYLEANPQTMYLVLENFLDKEYHHNKTWLGMYDTWDATMQKNLNNKTPITKTIMTDNDKRVLALSATLPNIDKIADDYKEHVVDCEYNAHHADWITISQQCEDYQVLRLFDIEIECTDPMEKATDEEKKAIEKEEESDEHGCYDNAWNSMLQRMYDNDIDPDHDYEFEEVIQYWLNVKTGEITMLGKVNKEDNYFCGFGEKFQVIQEGSRFHEHFYGQFGNGHYMDLSVHPLIQKHGYNGIEALNWYYGCGEDENVIDDAKFFKSIDKISWLDFIQNVALGGEWERRLKMFGTDIIVESYDYDRDYQQAFFEAMKIVKRNKYERKDKGLWRDMFVALVDLHKDIHNAYYVCPADLHEAHDRWTKLAHRKRKEIQKQKLLNDAKFHEEDYAKRMARFIGISASNDNFDIFVCPSVKAMAEEGDAMHHCVYRMGYYKESHNCIILLVRDKQGNRVATSEVRRDTWAIAQTRGNCNRIPELNGVQVVDEINTLIRTMLISKFKKATEPKIIPLNTNHTAEQPQVALAA